MERERAPGKASAGVLPPIVPQEIPCPPSGTPHYSRKPVFALFFAPGSTYPFTSFAQAHACKHRQTHTCAHTQTPPLGCLPQGALELNLLRTPLDSPGPFGLGMGCSLQAFLVVTSSPLPVPHAPQKPLYLPRSLIPAF